VICICVNTSFKPCCLQAILPLICCFVALFRLLIPVQTLVETYGAEILRSDDDAGHTAAHYACLNGYSTILKFIVDSHGAYDEPSHDAMAQHPIHWACAKGHIGIVDFLLQVQRHFVQLPYFF